MTPLAHRIVKELTLPIKDRTFVDRCGLLKKMSDIHCFDVTAVDDAAHDLAAQIATNPEKMIGQFAFLPAPRTWLEWGAHGASGRVGVLLEEVIEEKTGGRFAEVWMAGAEDFAGFSSGAGCSVMPLYGTDSLGKYCGISSELGEAIKNHPEDEVRAQGTKCFATQQLLIYATLALINTPRIVGRVTHLPHKGLERALIAKHGSAGRWPLHAWHEIKLSITPPDAVPGEIEEGHLTGKKALHFVRQHLRIRLGKLELVSAHWRGDAQLGIKRARYAVTH